MTRQPTYRNKHLFRSVRNSQIPVVSYVSCSIVHSRPPPVGTGAMATIWYSHRVHGTETKSNGVSWPRARPIRQRFAKNAKPRPSHFSRFCKSSENEHPNIILRIFVCDLGGRVEISLHKNSMKRITQ